MKDARLKEYMGFMALLSVVLTIVYEATGGAIMECIMLMLGALVLAVLSVG